MKKIKLLLFVLIFVISLLIFPTKANAANALVTITFADNNLYNSIKYQIMSEVFSTDDVRKSIIISRDNLQGITFLDLDNNNISDLTGIDSFTNLSGLILSNNNITNTLPLSGLKELTGLNLSNNKIDNVLPLSYLNKLEALNLSNNNISNVIPLSKLTNLNMLNLANNKITNISSFSTLINLESIYLEENKIQDITSLNLLNQLKYISLQNQHYEYNVNGNVLSNIGTNITLPTFFLQAKQQGSCNYTNTSFTVTGSAILSDDSTYVILKNAASGKKTISIKINGGNADGSIMLLNYNSVRVTVSNSILTDKIYERIGGTLSFVVNSLGDNTTNNISISIVKNGNYVTNNFAISKSVIDLDSAKYFINVPSSVTSGTYIIKVLYNNKLAITGSFIVNENPVITSIKLNTTKITLKPNQSYELKATISPSNTINKNVIWSSNNPSVVSVDSNGKITAIKYGSATIIAKAVDGGKIATCIVTVPKPVTGIFLNMDKTSLVLNETKQLVATVLPYDATDKSVVWSSSNSNVVSVDNSGIITAKAVGKAIITASAGNGNYLAGCEVTVTEPKPQTIPVQSISINKKTLTLVEGKTETLIVTITPDNATNKAFSWVSSNPKVATVDNNGKVTAISVGTAKIIANASDNTLGTKQAICEVTVKPLVIPVESISINKKALTLIEGKSETLIATITPDNATNKSFSWVSSNPKVATVDSNGKVTAISVGHAKIIANATDNTLGTKQAICEVTVISSSITSETYKIENNIIFNIPPKSDLCEFLPDLQIPISYKVYDSKGNEIVSTTTVCTGMYIELENGTCYYLVVGGDVSGDGKISATDIFSLKKHITSIQKLDGVYKNAADLNESNTVTVTDLLKMKKVVVGLI